MSSTTSESVASPSSLIWTHAPVPHSPSASGITPWSAGLCRLRSAPAGLGTFPTLVCKSVSMCLDPYPGGSWSAFARFFPQDFGLPYVRTRSALRISPYSNFSTDPISGLQSFASLEAHRFARHPGRSYRCAMMQPAPALEGFSLFEYRPLHALLSQGSRGFSI